MALKDWYKMRVERAERSGVQMDKVSAKWTKQWLDLGGRILDFFSSLSYGFPEFSTMKIYDFCNKKKEKN